MTRLESKLAQTHVALTDPTRQQVLQLMMTRLKFCFLQPLCFVISVYHFQNLNSIHFFIYSIGFAISSLVLISFFYKYSNGLKLCVKCIGYADICHDLWSRIYRNKFKIPWIDSFLVINVSRKCLMTWNLHSIMQLSVPTLKVGGSEKRKMPWDLKSSCYIFTYYGSTQADTSTCYWFQIFFSVEKT